MVSTSFSSFSQSSASTKCPAYRNVKNTSYCPATSLRYLNASEKSCVKASIMSDVTTEKSLLVPVKNSYGKNIKICFWVSSVSNNALISVSIPCFFSLLFQIDFNSARFIDLSAAKIRVAWMGLYLGLSASILGPQYAVTPSAI